MFPLIKVLLQLSVSLLQLLSVLNNTSKIIGLIETFDYFYMTLIISIYHTTYKTKLFLLIMMNIISLKMN